MRNNHRLIIKVPNPNEVKLKPIIEGPAYEPHHPCNILDTLLKPFLKHIKSSIKDDQDLLNHFLQH